MNGFLFNYFNCVIAAGLFNRDAFAVVFCLELTGEGELSLESG